MTDLPPAGLPRRPPQFDPRRIPVVGVDAHLPAVSSQALHAEALRQRFLLPPIWTPEVLAEKRFVDRPAVPAAVLLPIVMHSRPTILLTERTAHLSSHAGQIAFPGGKVDAEDVDAVATALREAHEEIGLQPALVQVLGQMPSYETGSAFMVTPVVALLQPGFSLQLNEFEVADAFEVPLDFLMNPAHHQRHRVEWEGVQREWFAMPYQQSERVERFIWGATAGMLRNLYRLLAA